MQNKILSEFNLRKKNYLKLIICARDNYQYDNLILLSMFRAYLHAET